MTLLEELRRYRENFRKEPCMPCKRLRNVCCTEPLYPEDNKRTMVSEVGQSQQGQQQQGQQSRGPSNQDLNSQNAPGEERARPADSALLNSRSAAHAPLTSQSRTGRQGRIAGSQSLVAQSIMTDRGAGAGTSGQTVPGWTLFREANSSERQSSQADPSQVHHTDGQRTQGQQTEVKQIQATTTQSQPGQGQLAQEQTPQAKRVQAIREQVLQTQALQGRAKSAQAQPAQVQSTQGQPSLANRRVPGLQALQAQFDRAQPQQEQRAQVQQPRDNPPQNKSSHGRELAHGSDQQARDGRPGRPLSFTRGNDLPLTAIPDDVPRRSWERRRSSRQSSFYSRRSQSMEELQSQGSAAKLEVPSSLPNTGDIRGGGDLKTCNNGTFHGGRLSGVLSRTASRLNDIRTRSVINLPLTRKSSVIFSRQPRRHRMPIGMFAPAHTDDNIRLFSEQCAPSCIQLHEEEEETRASGLVEAIQVRDRAHSSLSAYSTDSLSINVSACSSDCRVSSESAPTEVSDDGAELGGAASPSTQSSALDPAPCNGPITKNCTGTSHDIVQGAEGQMCKAAALGSVSAYDLPCPRQPIKRKMLPESNKAEDVSPEPLELSEDGEQFLKELELRFALSETIAISNERLPMPSPSSSLTSSLGKSVALELLCYPSYGKEVAVLEAPRHRSIRETFQNVVTSSNSMRWLRSVGKGRKKFSRPPIPYF